MSHSHSTSPPNRVSLKTVRKSVSHHTQSIHLDRLNVKNKRFWPVSYGKNGSFEKKGVHASSGSRWEDCTASGMKKKKNRLSISQKKAWGVEAAFHVVVYMLRCFGLFKQACTKKLSQDERGGDGGDSGRISALSFGKHRQSDSCPT